MHGKGKEIDVTYLRVYNYAAVSLLNYVTFILNLLIIQNQIIVL